MRLWALLVPLALALSACTEKEPASTQPAMTVSDAAHAEVTPAALLLDAAPSAISTDAAAPDVSDASSASPGITLVSAGAAPRSVLVYKFAPKARTVDAAMKRTQLTAAAKDSAAADLSFHFTFTATPRPKADAPGDATIDFTVTHVVIALPPNAPAKKISDSHLVEESFLGMVGHLDVSSHGVIGTPKYDSNKSGEAIEMLNRALDMMAVQLPTDPVGVGAKWTRSLAQNDDHGTAMGGLMTMTLMARDAQTATIKVEASNSGTAAINDPQAPKGSVLERNASSTATSVIRFDGIPAKCDGDSRLDATQKVPGQEDQKFTLAIVKKLESK
jgi:hypothetical protein